MTFAETVVTQEPKKVEKIGEGKFGARLVTFANGYRAVLKTTSSSARNYDEKIDRFRGIRLDTVPYREVAFYELAKLIGWQDIVPQTVLGSYKGEVASFQMFVPSIYVRDMDPRTFTSKTSKKRAKYICRVGKKFPRNEWRRLVLLDLIANNRDRHGKNVVVRLPGPHVVAIDNSIAFGKTFSRYRNVFHKYLFREAFDFIPYELSLRRLTRKKLDVLAPYLSQSEINHVFLRTQFILRFPYLLPFEKFSDGQRGMNDFPTRKEFFDKEGARFEVRQLVVVPEQGYAKVA